LMYAIFNEFLLFMIMNGLFYCVILVGWLCWGFSTTVWSSKW
jgi:hypothetical protein